MQFLIFDTLFLPAEMELPECKYREMVSKLQKESEMFGLEVSPFKVGWYNDAVADKKFQFPDDSNTLAFIVISTPSMFEKAFLPFLKEELTGGMPFEIRDPLDRCMKETLLRLSKLFGNDYQITPIHDFEISPITKRPKVLVQTAGHVAAAVRFYQKCDLKEETENDAVNSESEELFINRIHSSKVFPVCLHPQHGGWFALRGILLFKGVNVVDSYLNRSDPPKILKTKYDIANLLYLFNENWRDSRYRDVGMPSDIERYSDSQLKYFVTAPSERSELIQEMIKHQRRHKLIQNSNNSLTEKLSNISI